MEKYFELQYHLQMAGLFILAVGLIFWIGLAIYCYLKEKRK